MLSSCRIHPVVGFLLLFVFHLQVNHQVFDYLLSYQSNAVTSLRRLPNATSNTNDSFPRWGDEKGMNFEAIRYYSDWFNTKYPDSVRDFLHREDFPVPNLLYILGGSPNATTTMDVSKTDGSNLTPLQVWVANRRRQRTQGFLVRDRHWPLEQLLVDSLDFLVNQTSSTMTSKWSRLQNLVQSTGVPFFVNVADIRWCNQDNFNNMVPGKNFTLPVFTLCAANKASHCNYSLPLPSYKTLQDVKQHSSSWEIMFKRQNRHYPWQNKTRQVVWRGANTGKPIVSPELRAKVRQLNKYVNIASPELDRYLKTPIRKHMIYQTLASNVRTAFDDDRGALTATTNQSQPPLFDVAMCPGATRDYMDMGEILPVAPKIEFEDFQSYMAVLDVDGNSWSSRFGSLLCQNSVVLKVEPEFVDYFYPKQLQPWVHYVPVAMDSSDIIDIARYVLDPANGIQMQQIVKNANQWCQENMLYDNLIQEVLDTMAFYVEQMDRGSGLSWPETFETMKTEEFLVSNGFQPVERNNPWRPEE